MKHASRTTKIQYCMERINITPVYILPAPAYCFERKSRNKSDIFRQIHSIRLVLYNYLGNIYDVYLGERTFYSPYSIAGNNRLLQTYKMELVKVCYFGNVRINDSVFSNNIENSDNANSSSNRSWLYRKPDGRSLLQLNNSWILRRLHLGNYPANFNIQLFMVDSSSNIKSRCEAEYRFLFGRDVNCNINQLNRLWDLNSWICNSTHRSLSRKYSGIYFSIHFHVYPSSALFNHRFISSNRTYNPQCPIQLRICDSILNRRSFNSINFPEIKKSEAIK